MKADVFDSTSLDFKRINFAHTLETIFFKNVFKLLKVLFFQSTTHEERIQKKNHEQSKDINASCKK